MGHTSVSCSLTNLRIRKQECFAVETKLNNCYLLTGCKIANASIPIGVDIASPTTWLAPVLWSSCYERTIALAMLPLPGRVGRSAAEPGAAWQRAAYSAGDR